MAHVGCLLVRMIDLEAGNDEIRCHLQAKAEYDGRPSFSLKSPSNKIMVRVRILEKMCSLSIYHHRGLLNSSIVSSRREIALAARAQIPILHRPAVHPL